MTHLFTIYHHDTHTVSNQNSWNIIFSGDLWYKDLHVFSNVKPDDVQLEVFNDTEDHKPHFKREHLILLEVNFTSGASVSPFTGEQRRWLGTGNICFSAKTKRKYLFTGRDIGKAVHSNDIIEPTSKAFLGSKKLPRRVPGAEQRLYPLDRYVRTLLG